MELSEFGTMPIRHSAIRLPKLKAGQDFHRRYDDAEALRNQLIKRLAALGEPARQHLGFKHVKKLLNDSFRGASVGQRSSVLQAAAWLIQVLEHNIRQSSVAVGATIIRDPHSQ
jgi:hypothetical protein